MRLVLVVAVLPAACVAMCPYIDGHWAVNYMRGQLLYHPDNTPEPPRVTQAGRDTVAVRWGDLVRAPHCVDRYILHVWDTRQRLMRYIYNSSDTVEAVVRVPRCAKLYVQVEIQEDDLRGHAPDSEFTGVAEAALATRWLEQPLVNTNRSEVTISREHSHWSQVFQASHLKGVLLDWAGRVANLGCVRRVVVVVSRLVKGRLSDHVKTVRVAVPRRHSNITLALPCEDKLPYSLQVELVEEISIHGVKTLFAERSAVLEVPLVCPWSEPAPAPASAPPRLVQTALLIPVLVLCCTLSPPASE